MGTRLHVKKISDKYFYGIEEDKEGNHFPTHYLVCEGLVEEPYPDCWHFIGLKPSYLEDELFEI